MKEGTGGDPFADDPIDSSDDAANSKTSTSDSMSETTTSTLNTTTEYEPTDSLPYIYRRDTVKENRDQVPFFLHDYVQKLEDEFIEQLEERLDENVYKADAREVALEIAFEEQVDEAVDRLREWGYDR